jgi:hypothetical protein
VYIAVEGRYDAIRRLSVNGEAVAPFTSGGVRMITPLALTHKYFIFAIPDPHGRIFHGQILGPIGEWGLYFLCEVYTVDPAQLGVRSQVIFSLDQLAGASVHLYDDKAIFEIEWAQFCAELDVAQQKAARKRRRSGAGAGVRLVRISQDGTVEDVE